MNRVTAQGFFFFAVVFLALVVSGAAQDTNPAQTSARTTADENFTLDITESRVNEANYERSTAVQLGGTQSGAAVEVRVGANVRAQNIVITLRGVTGSVRFRASLEKIRRLLE